MCLKRTFVVPEPPLKYCWNGYILTAHAQVLNLRTNNAPVLFFISNKDISPAYKQHIIIFPFSVSTFFVVIFFMYHSITE